MIRLESPPSSGEEVWRAVARSDKFEISSHGRLLNRKTGAIKQGTRARSGYDVVNLYAHGFARICNVHTLVAEAFLGPCPNDHVVVHLDGDPGNNHCMNLAYVSRRDLTREAIDKAGTAPGCWPIQRLDRPDAHDIRERARQGEATRDLARQFGVSESHVSRIKSGQKWR